jgi:hypothetical protein
MAIVNRTPDSFYDKGKTFALDNLDRGGLPGRAMPDAQPPVLENGGAGRIAVGAPLTPRGMRLGHVLAAGDMLMLRYERAR